MGLKFIDILAVLVLNLIQNALAENILSCNDTALEPCPGDNQVCNATSHECVCLKGFMRIGDDCEAPIDDTPRSHSATAVVVTVFTLALVICGLVLVIRKYNLIDYVRQRINQRRNNDVMYEDVMIGNDDPPLTP